MRRLILIFSLSLFILQPPPPPEKVIKIIVKDPAATKKTVYYLHDVDDIRSIKIDTPRGKNAADKTVSVIVEKVRY